MKIITYLIIAVAVFVVLLELSTDKPNVYLTSAGIVIFMYAMMRLSAKTPSKNPDDDDTEI